MLTENDLEEIQRWNSRGDYSGRPGELKRDLDLLVDSVRRLKVALTHLSNEVMGSLPLIEAQARQDMGNTNYTCIMERAKEARVLLASK